MEVRERSEGEREIGNRKRREGGKKWKERMKEGMDEKKIEKEI